MKDEKKLVDTNILVHGYVLINARKYQSARDFIENIWRKGNGITTLQNLCEFFSVVTKHIENPMPIERAREIVEQILISPKWQVIDRDEKTFLKAIELVKDFKIPFWGCSDNCLHG
jgi:predicted nucleic acid-binding protein